MEIHLKVKLISLALETKQIRRIERKLASRQRKRATDAEHSRFSVRREQQRESIYLHRINEVRKETRSANLAYGFIRGRTYLEVENIAYSEPDWDRVLQIAQKFGAGVHIDPRDMAQRFAAWKADFIVAARQAKHHVRPTNWTKGEDGLWKPVTKAA